METTAEIRFSEKGEELLRKEEQAKETTQHNLLWLFLVNAYASLSVFLTHLISLEGVLGICISVGLTVYLHETTDDSFSGDALDWVLLSFAVITPISAAINMSFSRRERALNELASFRASILALYQAHAVWGWNWKTNASGRPDAVDSLKHSDETMLVLLNISIYMTRYLTLPNCTRARHKTTIHGRKEASGVFEIAAGIVLQVENELGSLGALCEYLKANGLPGNEAARMRQYERFLSENFERLRVVKRYRTPQGLRSFGRLFSFFLPTFYAPYYADLARSLNSLGVGITFAALTSVALTSLFETASQMEDPFIETSLLDGIDTKQGRSEVLSNLGGTSWASLLFVQINSALSSTGKIWRRIFAAKESHVKPNASTGLVASASNRITYLRTSLVFSFFVSLLGRVDGMHPGWTLGKVKSWRGGDAGAALGSEDDTLYHIVGVVPLQDTNGASSTWLSPGCTVVPSSLKIPAPTDSWNAGDSTLVETLALVSDVVVLCVASEEAEVTRETRDALLRGWQRRQAQGLPPGRLWVVWVGSHPHNAQNWIENVVLQEWTADLPVADWQLCEGPESYQLAVSELGCPTRAPLVPVEGLPFLIDHVYSYLHGSMDTLFVKNDEQNGPEMTNETPNESVLGRERYESTSIDAAVNVLDAESALEDEYAVNDGVESVYRELDTLQSLLDDYWLTDSSAGLTLPPDLVKALPSQAAHSAGLLPLLEQHAQILRDYYGRLYESLLESGRASGGQILQSLSKQYQATVMRVAKHLGLTETSAYEPSFRGLQEDIAEINERWMSASQVLLEDEETDEEGGSSTARRRIPPWARRLAVRLLVLGANYLQGWLAWKGVQRAALERERALPKFPLF